MQRLTFRYREPKEAELYRAAPAIRERVLLARRPKSRVDLAERKLRMYLRNEKIRDLAANGSSIRAIAREYGLSRRRIRQIVPS